MNKGFASISFAIKTAISVIILISVWVSLSSYVSTLKTIEMTNKMQDVAEYIDAKVLYSLKLLQNMEYSYMKEKVYLPDYGEYYAASIGCAPGDYLYINATDPIKGINFIIKDYINCSNMNISGSFLPGGERCIYANRVGTTINIRLVNDCGSI
jgi:hypothetical protein